MASRRDFLRASVVVPVGVASTAVAKAEEADGGVCTYTSAGSKFSQAVQDVRRGQVFDRESYSRRVRDRA